MYDDVPSPDSKTYLSGSLGEDAKCLASRTRPIQSLPQNKQRTHPSLRPGNVTWEKLLGPQAAVKYCHLELSNLAEQKLPDLNCACPGIMNGPRQS